MLLHPRYLSSFSYQKAKVPWCVIIPSDENIGLIFIIFITSARTRRWRQPWAWWATELKVFLTSLTKLENSSGTRRYNRALFLTSRSGLTLSGAGLNAGRAVSTNSTRGIIEFFYLDKINELYALHHQLRNTHSARNLNCFMLIMIDQAHLNLAAI